jgi:hypothetical protein
VRTDRQRGGRTDRGVDGETDMTKLIVSFRNFGKAPKNRRTNLSSAKYEALSVVKIHILAFCVLTPCIPTGGSNFPEKHNASI